MPSYLRTALPVVGLLAVLAAPGQAPAAEGPPRGPGPGGRWPGGLHTISAVAGAAMGHKLVTPPSGGRVFVVRKVEQFLANRPIDVWIVPRPLPDPPDEFSLRERGILVQTVRTNADGQITSFPVDRPLVIGDVLILEYDCDGQYQSRLDAALDTWVWAKHLVLAAFCRSPMPGVYPIEGLPNDPEK